MKRTIVMTAMAGSLLIAGTCFAQQRQMETVPFQMDKQDIKALQQKLDQQGFKVGPADGNWGSRTERALKEFQQKNNLQATGKLDTQTLAVLGINMSAQGANEAAPNATEESGTQTYTGSSSSSDYKSGRSANQPENQQQEAPPPSSGGNNMSSPETNSDSQD